MRSTIDLAHNLGLTVVAEGVEDEVAMDLLVAYDATAPRQVLKPVSPKEDTRMKLHANARLRLKGRELPIDQAES